MSFSVFEPLNRANNDISDVAYALTKLGYERAADCTRTAMGHLDAAEAIREDMEQVWFAAERFADSRTDGDEVAHAVEKWEARQLVANAQRNRGRPLVGVRRRRK